MHNLTLTKITFQGGVWHGVLGGVAPGAEAPKLQLLLRGQPVGAVELSADPTDDAQRRVRIELPREVIGEGVQSLMIVAEDNTAPLFVIRLAAGEALEQDLQSEIEQLRAELDLLKSAFRRHCAETT